MRGYRLATSLPGSSDRAMCTGREYLRRDVHAMHDRTAKISIATQAEGRGHCHAVILACNAMTHKMARGRQAGTFVARDPDATRSEIAREYRVRFCCYLRHDYLRGVGTLACASFSLNYRLILHVFGSDEVIQTSSLPASWIGNAERRLPLRASIDHVTLPSTCR